MSGGTLIQKPGANQQVAAGVVVFTERAPAKSLVMLQKGKVSIRVSPIGSEGDIGGSLYLYSLSGPAILGGLELALGSSYNATIITESPSIISVYPSNQAHLEKIFAAKPNIAAILLRTALTEIELMSKKRQGVEELLRDAFNITSSLSLAYSRMLPEQFVENAVDADQSFQDYIISQARRIVSDFEENGGVIPQQVTASFLEMDHHSLLSPSEDIADPMEDDAAYNFFRRFVKLPPDILGAIARSDISLLLDAARSLGRILHGWFNWQSASFESSLEVSNQLAFGPYSWLEKIYLQIDLAAKGMIKISQSDMAIVASFFHRRFDAFQQEFNSIWGALFPEYSKENMGKIVAFSNSISQPKEEAKPTADADDDADSFDGMEELEGSFRKILEWAELPGEKVSEFENLLIKIKQFNNPMDSKDDVRKVRRRLNLLFWETYHLAARKHIHQKQPLIRPVELFLNFGYMDEGFLEREHLIYINRFLDDIKRKKQSKHPIYYPIEWLTRIYNKESPTSINELGLTYFEILRQDSENRNKKWKREEDLPAELVTGDKLLDYEIKNMFETNAKLASGSIMNHFSILNSFQITQKIENSFISREKLSENIDRLLGVDFSAYHREILFTDEKLGIRREFVQKQVIPNFILVPTAGQHFQFWMDREGKDRSSPGRLIGPMLHVVDLYTMVVNATGVYRWEALKTQLGVDWNNVAQSSLTADYTDYVQFFKKNRDLSPEAKEKLAVEFKRFRDDRSRFVHDYMLFVRFEAEGTQRLNKAARKILIKHIPFLPEVRDALLKLPSYTDLITKSINIRKRKANELKPRYTKYERDNKGVLPEELKKNMEFFST